MNKDRRQFFKEFSVNAAAAVISTARPIGADLGAFSKDINAKIIKLRKEVSDQISGLSRATNSKLDQFNEQLHLAVTRIDYQQMQLNLIFVLLLISFLLDGGMAWVTFN